MLGFNLIARLAQYITLCIYGRAHATSIISRVFLLLLLLLLLFCNIKQKDIRRVPIFLSLRVLIYINIYIYLLGVFIIKQEEENKKNLVFFSTI